MLYFRTLLLIELNSQWILNEIVLMVYALFLHIIVDRIEFSLNVTMLMVYALFPHIGC